MKKIKLAIREAGFGASTSMEVVIDNMGVIEKVTDTSQGTTNNIWDGWGRPMGAIRGMVLSDLILQIETRLALLSEGTDFNPYLVLFDLK